MLDWRERDAGRGRRRAHAFTKRHGSDATAIRHGAAKGRADSRPATAERTRGRGRRGRPSRGTPLPPTPRRSILRDSRERSNPVSDFHGVS
jgi:hypothetical protein